MTEKTVLVVDDEEPFLLSLVDALLPHASDFRVVTALEGRTALELLARLPVDLVITDLKMPGMDGFELLRQLRAARPRLPVIVMTAYSTPGMEEYLEAFAPVAILEKPIDLEHMVRSIGRVLSRESSAAGMRSILTLLAALTLHMAAMPPTTTSHELNPWALGVDVVHHACRGQDWTNTTCSDTRA